MAAPTEAALPPVVNGPLSAATLTPSSGFFTVGGCQNLLIPVPTGSRPPSRSLKMCRLDWQGISETYIRSTDLSQ
jgi:hypothetical protein